MSKAITSVPAVAAGEHEDARANDLPAVHPHRGQQHGGIGQVGAGEDVHRDWCGGTVVRHVKHMPTGSRCRKSLRKTEIAKGVWQGQALGVVDQGRELCRPLRQRGVAPQPRCARGARPERDHRTPNCSGGIVDIWVIVARTRRRLGWVLVSTIWVYCSPIRSRRHAIYKASLSPSTSRSRRYTGSRNASIAATQGQTGAKNASPGVNECSRQPRGRPGPRGRPEGETARGGLRRRDAVSIEGAAARPTCTKRSTNRGG